MFAIFHDKFIYYWNYGVRFRGNNIAYLRYLGARIGNDCTIGTSIRNFGTEPWLVEIGNNVTVTDGVRLITHDGASRLFRKDLPGMNSLYGNRFGIIQILDNCFLGINTIVLPGIRIGPNAIIGAGSVVTKDVPANSIFAGNPARFIVSLDEYKNRYLEKMVSIQSTNRVSLRKELTLLFWKEER